LLCVGRDQIVAYLREKDQTWRQDHTNADCTHRRNYIRHRLLPEVQRCCANSVAEQLFELAQSARRLHVSVCARAERLWPELADETGTEITLDLRMFLREPPAVKVELIRRCLARLGCGERDLTRRHYESILGLAEQNVSGSKTELPGGFVVCREYDKLILGPSPKRPGGQDWAFLDNQGDKSVTLNVPGQTRFSGYLIEATILDAGCSIPDARRRGKTRIANRESRIQLVERFDLDKVRLPLTVRPRRPGDRFVPLGRKAAKKVGKFLTAQRLPHQIRNRVLVVADAEKIIWIWPVRMSEQAKVTAETGKILQLRMTDINHRQNSVDAAGPGQ
jgi:tRNA(Ile)-lysidine synthase